MTALQLFNWCMTLFYVISKIEKNHGFFGGGGDLVENKTL